MKRLDAFQDTAQGDMLVTHPCFVALLAVFMLMALVAPVPPS